MGRVHTSVGEKPWGKHRRHEFLAWMESRWPTMKALNNDGKGQKWKSIAAQYHIGISTLNHYRREIGDTRVNQPKRTVPPTPTRTQQHRAPTRKGHAFILVRPGSQRNAETKGVPVPKPYMRTIEQFSASELKALVSRFPIAIQEARQ